MTPTVSRFRSSNRQSGEPRNVGVTIIASLIVLLVFVIVALVT
jgi:hypothetical protein